MILGLETASNDLSIALAGRGGELLASDGWSGGDRQGAELLPRLMTLLGAAGRRLDELDAVGVGIGPGSFTGLRVGLSVAKGLALATGCRLVGLPSLVAWLAAEPDCDAALARAGAREAFVLTRGLPDALVVAYDALPERIRRAPVVASAELAAAVGLREARPPFGAAGAVARLAAERLAIEPQGDDMARLEPAYGRGPRGIGAIDAEAIRWL